MTLYNKINSNNKLALILATLTGLASFYGDLKAMKPRPAQPKPVSTVVCREGQRDIFAAMEQSRQQEIARQTKKLAKEQLLLEQPQMIISVSCRDAQRDIFGDSEQKRQQERTRQAKSLQIEQQRLEKDDIENKKTLERMKQKFAQLKLSQPEATQKVSRVTFLERYDRGTQSQEREQKERAIVANINDQTKRAQLKCATLRQERLQCMKPKLINPAPQPARVQTPGPREGRHVQEFWAEKTKNPLLMCLTREQMNVLMSDTKIEDLELPQIKTTHASEDNV